MTLRAGGEQKAQEMLRLGWKTREGRGRVWLEQVAEQRCVLKLDNSFPSEWDFFHPNDRNAGHSVLLVLCQCDPSYNHLRRGNPTEEMPP